MLLEGPVLHDAGDSKVGSCASEGVVRRSSCRGRKVTGTVLGGLIEDTRAGYIGAATDSEREADQLLLPGLEVWLKGD